MRADVRSFENYDLEPIAEHVPTDLENFRVRVRLLVGPVGSIGAESFDLEVCSPRWLEERLGPREVISGRHLLIMRRWNWSAIEAYIREQVDQCEGDDWSTVGEKVGRLGYWEFEDYSAAP